MKEDYYYYYCFPMFFVQNYLLEFFLPFHSNFQSHRNLYFFCLDRDRTEGCSGLENAYKLTMRITIALECAIISGESQQIKDYLISLVNSTIIYVRCN